MNLIAVKLNKSKLSLTAKQNVDFLLKSFLMDSSLSKVIKHNSTFEVIYDDEYKANILFLENEVICGFSDNIKVKELYNFIRTQLEAKFAHILI